MSPRDRLASVLAAEVLDALEGFVAEKVAVELANRPNSPAAPWLTLDQAGELLGCSRDAVRMRIKRGRLESRRHGRRIYVSAASVAELA